MIALPGLEAPDQLQACGFDDLGDALTEELADPDPATTLAIPGLSVEAHQLVEAFDQFRAGRHPPERFRRLKVL